MFKRNKTFPHKITFNSGEILASMFSSDFCRNSILGENKGQDVEQWESSTSGYFIIKLK